MAIKLRHTKRYKEIATALVRHGFGYIAEEMGLFQLLSLPRKWIKGGEDKQALTWAVRIRLVLEELGPSFVKLGQLSSTRKDLLPADVIVEMKKLQDQVPAFSMREVRQIIERELNAPLESLFASFDEVPTAAASIGQVHYARLISGEAVAVKVQRPMIEEIIKLDLEILQELVPLAERRLDGVSQYKIGDVLSELSKSMMDELNYTHEGRNADKIARQFQHHPHIHIPKVYWNYTTSKVLTLEWLEGIQLGDLQESEEPAASRKVVAERLVNAMLHQILVEGVFHADPHPGNLFVLPGDRLAFVDFGMVGRLSEKLRYQLTSLLIAMMRHDTEAVARAVVRMGMVEDDVDMDALEKDLDRLRERYYDLPLAQVSLNEAVTDLFTIAGKHHIRIPTDLTLLGKALLTLEGVTASLDPDMSIVDLAEPFGRRLVRERFHPNQVRKRLWKDTTETVSALSQLPRQLTQVGKLLRSGKLRMEIGLADLEPLLRKLDQVSNRISFSIVLLSFSIVMVGLMFAASTGNEPAFLVHLPVMEIGSVIAGLMLLWLLYAIFKSGRF
ncbi:MAG: AarF/ABC1/UbiB kinase family protein [Gorillibacterium sp.]|nr:AarF/ABC1/UbiB kinase family protein [Gorillibacterium sp.]